MSYRLILRVAMAASLALISLPAAAQAPGPQHGYVVGLGGMGSTQVNSPFFGASFGVNVTQNLQVTFDAGRMQDVQAKFTRQDFTLVDQLVTAETGLASTTTVKMPTNYATAGLRYLAPTRDIRPYVSISGGVAHMSPQASFVVGPLDVSSLVLQDQVVKTMFREDTRPMASVGGGVALNIARHLTVDVGYKYSAIFIARDYLQDFTSSPHSHNRIDTHRVFTGFGVTF